MKIFLSSTFLDLHEIRAETARWLHGVFSADLVVMETFGSDADPPDIHSVGRVRECDLFVGIYAHRYGTIDPGTGKSITELELDEARRSYSAGSVSDMLLYRIVPGVDWLRLHAETSPAAIRRLEALKRKTRHHTCDNFRDRDELLFKIVRDVHRRVAEELGGKVETVRHINLPHRRSLDQPIGMEFLSSAQRDYLVGRREATSGLLALLASNPIVLLLGESGVGKTSLIHAGLLPAAVRRGMYPIYTRPFGLPSGDILRQVLTTAYAGRPTYRGPLVPLLTELAVALKGKTLLFVIDQFEDVLASREDTETLRLVADIGSLRQPSSTKIRTLIAYRADLEGRLGSLWQRVSGSPAGLPRYYLGGIPATDAWLGVVQSVSALGVTMKCTALEGQAMTEALSRASTDAGHARVYPPFVQMLIHHIWRATTKGALPYTYETYRAAGGVDRILGEYLERLLQYAGDDNGNTRAVLAALVRSYGVKAHLTLDEVCAEASSNPEHTETALERLIDSRLVRHVRDLYEVSHDFVAKRIAADLLTPGELEVKRYKELLSSKAAAYSTTKRRLDREELLMLYKHRERIVPGEPELRLLLTTWLDGRSPGLYWLLQADPSLVFRLLNRAASGDTSQEAKTSVVLLRRKLSGRPLRSADFAAFKNYKLSAEQAYLITQDPRHIPREVVLLGLRHRREEVKEACLKALLTQVSGGKGWIDELRSRGSDWARESYESLVLATEVTASQARPPSSRASTEFGLLRQLASAQTGAVAVAAFRDLGRIRPPGPAMAFADGLRLARSGRIGQLLRRAERLSESRARRTLGGISAPITTKGFVELLSTYECWADAASEAEYRGRRHAALAEALATAIRRVTSSDNIHLVRECLPEVPFGPSTRWLVLAGFEHGGLRELDIVLRRIGGEESEVEFRNHTALGRALARRLESTCSGVPGFLRRLSQAQEFWDFVPAPNRHALRVRDRLPLENARNRSLYVRLAAYGMIGSAGRQDEQLLLRLSTHPYRFVASSAAIRLSRLFGQTALTRLAQQGSRSLTKGTAESLAGAIRAAEISLYGLADLW